MERFDQVHVVSDLHLGGVAGRQVMNQGQALAQLIDHLARTAPGARVALVLNGDIVDFLAAEDARHFDAEGAPRKLGAILAAPELTEVWGALGRFTRTEGRALVLVVGNHDVELCLPEVRDALVAHITGGDDAARGRVRLALDGTGFCCEVGQRRVYCVHGNDADPWNVVDHAALRAFVASQKAARRVAPPPANAGTRLVVDVMNEIKARYPFVDLLKPETVPVPGVLLALPARWHAPLLEFAKITARLAWDDLRMRPGFLGADGPSLAPPGAGVTLPDARPGAGVALPDARPGAGVDGYQALELLLRASRPAAPAPARESWLAQAEADFAAGERPLDVTGEGTEMLGVGGLVWDRISGRDPEDNLRLALRDYLAGDRTFAFDTEDETFRALDATVGEDVSFVVAGHTHLERRLLRERGRGVYFNSGTWIRLMRLGDDVLRTREAFAPVYRALSTSSLADLDALPGLVLARRTLVSIWAEAGAVHGELRHAVGAGEAAAGEPPWQAVAGTRHTLRDTEA